MNMLIHNATILPMNNKKDASPSRSRHRKPKNSRRGKDQELKRKYGRGYERIDATDKVVIPGLVNTYQHAAISLLRGYADDLPLQEWLEKGIGLLKT